MALIAVLAQGQEHWAFRAPRVHPTPAVADAAWARDAIDLFVLQRLAGAGLQHSPDADPSTLVRRVYLDLTGLPPTPADIDVYLADQRPDRYERLVDRVLASPHFGERFAVPWLDAARYADTNGFSIDDHRDMWAWRDWVIQSLNDNMPFDRFLTLQLAGDLVDDADDTTRLATGFLRNGANTHEGGTIPAEYRVIYIADKVDTVASTFMGLTMRCAQCHDHEYDPISQREYYGMYAFFDTAHEPGMGATNGNTAPTIAVEPPIGGSQMLLQRTAARLAELRQARRHPAHLEAVRDRWIASEAAKLGPDAGRPVALSMPKPDAKSGQRVRWIWSDRTGNDKKVRFERTLSLRGPVESAALVVTCDNAAEIRINGKVVGKLDDWLRPIVVDVRGALQAGDNVIRIDATNYGGPAGLVAVLQYQVDGVVDHVVTDTNWKVTRVGDAERAASAVDVAAYGAGPWNKIFDAAFGQLGLPVALATPAEARTDEMWDAINDAFSRVEARMRHHLQATAREIGIQEAIAKSGKASVMVMREKGPRNTYVLIRGEYDKPDEKQRVRPHGPAVIPGLSEGRRTRLDLARWLTSPKHPLTSRVAVNRIWQTLFGRGLVATPDDFGVRGSPPSHPELLDTLARSFVGSGWNVKAMVRRIMLSSTYRQSSDASPDAVRIDPDNVLLGRGARFRLSAEHVRDNVLAISGLLERDLGGPPVYPPQPDGLWREVSHYGYAPAFTAQAFFPSSGKNRFRRSLYTFLKRTSPPPAMSAFDAPNREVCTLQRSTTNTPLQALVLLNDPQFVEAARALAQEVSGLDDTDGVRLAFRRATGREPDAFEKATLLASLRRSLERFSADREAARDLVGSEVGDGPALVRRAAWTVVSSIILNLDETMTRR